MEIEPMSPDGTIHIHPIGLIHSPVKEQQTGDFEEVESTIALPSEFEDFLVGLEEYSHLKVIYWLSEMTESHGLHRPQGNAEVPVVGMFACR